MSVTASSSFLRRVLGVDAVLSAAMGALMVLAAAPLSSLLNLPASLLTWSGLSLLPFAAFVGWLATREMPPRAAVWVVIALNAVWTVDSLLLLTTGWVEPNLLGKAFVVVQALVVAVLAELEFFGLRRVGRLVAA